MSAIKIVKVPERTALRLECKGCKYRWNYMGSSRFRASCPRCRDSISLIKVREKGGAI